MVPEDRHATDGDEPLAVGEQPDRLVVMAEVEVERGEAGMAQPDQVAEHEEPDDDGDDEQDHGRLGAARSTMARTRVHRRPGFRGGVVSHSLGSTPVELVRLDGVAGGFVRWGCGLRHAQPTVPGTGVAGRTDDREAGPVRPVRKER